MKKNVGLLTMHRVVNCGSQLQTYALQKTVENLGYACEVIDYKYPDIYHYHQKMGTGDFSTIKGVMKKLMYCLGLLRFAQALNIRLFNLRTGAKLRCGFKGVNLTRPYTINSIKRTPPKYDIFLSGSDQVWNPGCIVGDYTFLFDFVRDGSRKIAYSSSFGLKALPDEVKADYKRLLKEFGAIGVRETSGVEIVKDLTGQDAVAVLDPTMLLSVAQWEGYATQTRLNERRYIFCYVLSYVFKSTPWIMGYATRIAELLGCEVVFYGGGERDCLADARAAGFKVIDRYISPQEFIRYYLDAEYVIATGFHGTAFSITLGKNFSVVANPHPTNDDRVMSLVRRLGLEERSITCGEDYSWLDTKWLKRGVPKAEKEFERQKRLSLDFLKGALGE